jgi:hypothetical protein
MKHILNTKQPGCISGNRIYSLHSLYRIIF